MEELTASQKARIAIRSFKVTADALVFRGFYKPSGTSGQRLEEALEILSPEIYASMNDPRIVELKGLKYVIDRLPRGIEECTRIALTAQEELENTSFERITPLKRRRIAYRVGEKEMCFAITRGTSEIYDLLTHLTFLNIEAKKIQNQMKEEYSCAICKEWRALEKIVLEKKVLKGKVLDQAIWNLSYLLGRTYQETKETYEYLEHNRKTQHTNNSLFSFIYNLGKRVEIEKLSPENELFVSFTPSLRDMLGHHRYSNTWAHNIKNKICELNLKDRPIHIISANMHSFLNLIYGYSAIKSRKKEELYSFIKKIRKHQKEVQQFAAEHGFYELLERSGTHIDCQIIDTAQLENVAFHPDFKIKKSKSKATRKESKTKKPVLIVMDYAFGTQAFEVMDELLKPLEKSECCLNFRSISIMGKAGTLLGEKGDIMLASSHVLEGTPDNYIISNDLTEKDFDSNVKVYSGPMVTVLGTSLQNKDVLEKFQLTSWKAVGLEMEGGHYQRAINAAIIRGHIAPNIKLRYAYYASDNPIVSGQTLASGGMGEDGITPTYMISKIILEKILNNA